MKHVFGLFDSNMADSFDRSFSLEELEINEIEERASVPNFENLTTCSCRSNCIRERSMQKLLPVQKSRPILFKCLPRWKFAMPE